MLNRPRPVLDGTCAPALDVPDLDRAVHHYSTVLGFARQGPRQDGVQLMASGGARVVLRQTPEAPPVTAQEVTGPPAVVVDVPDVAATRRRLDSRGAAVSPVHETPGGLSFVLADGSGNHFWVVQGARPPGWRIRHRVRESGLEPIARRRRQRRADDREAPHRDEFQRFLSGLPDVGPRYFMFFTGDLLHWALTAESLVPDDVPLVLVGSRLSDAEVSWIRSTVTRPFHLIRLPVDDKTVWEFLFDLQQGPFGWLDIDCLVLEPNLFRELLDIGDDVAVNGTWSYDSGFGYRLVNTHFAVVNGAVVRQLRESGLHVTPSTYDWHGANRRVMGHECYSRVPDRSLRAALLEVAPAGPDGLPLAPAGNSFFDTLTVYQMVARARGYRIELVRELDTPVGGGTTQEMSPELVHIGGISYFERFFTHSPARILYLGAESAILKGVAGRLPENYAARLRRMEDEVSALGMGTDAAIDVLRDHLVEHRGLSGEAVDRLLSPDLRLPRG